MSTDRLFMTSPAIDGRDEIEDYWLKNRDYVLSIPQVSIDQNIRKTFMVFS